ncbi:MAG: tetratricopeptide repeat protein [Candidatus Eisenbacteria bacterium]
MRITRWLAAFAVGTLVFVAACSNPHLSGGKLHYDQKRYERAEENFQLAVEETPENGEAWMFLAMSQAEQGKNELAAANFAKAAELAPPGTPLVDSVKQNREHFFSNRFNSAVAFSEEAEELKGAGDEAGAKKKFESALDELDTALMFKPESSQARSNLGIIYLKLGRIDDALATFDELRQNPEPGESSDRVNQMLLQVYSGQGNESFSQAIELRESDPAEAKRYLEAALDLYDKALAIDENDIESRQNQAAVAWELADNVGDENATRKTELLQKARGGYEFVLVKEPDNLEVMRNLMLLTSAMGDQDTSLDFAHRLLNLDPKNSTNWVQVGRILGQKDQKTAMFGHLLVGQALSSGAPLVAAEARGLAEKNGPRSQQLDRYRESGEPEEIRQYTDSGGGVYQVWFYWSRGHVYAFQSGKEIFAGEFEKIAPATPE